MAAPAQTLKPGETTLAILQEKIRTTEEHVHTWVPEYTALPQFLRPFVAELGKKVVGVQPTEEFKEELKLLRTEASRIVERIQAASTEDFAKTMADFQEMLLQAQHKFVER
ncbi:MAG TPA: hypothetical protein VL944_01435 [Candidatus Acidoferrum sp.]|nr:hypothetical protein [Candidatus Acidoferrum sp.]